MTNTNEEHQPSTPSSRRAQCIERQARVGILRNPNQPPRPPLRRAALMGKWPRLRSTRRARADTEGTPAIHAPDTPAAQPLANHSPSRAQESEALSDADLARLMKGARDIGEAKIPRSSHAGNRQTDPGLAHVGPAGPCGPLPRSSMMARFGTGDSMSQPLRSDSLHPCAPETRPAPDQPPQRETGRLAQGIVVVTGFGFLGIVAFLFAGP